MWRGAVREAWKLNVIFNVWSPQPVTCRDWKGWYFRSTSGERFGSQHPRTLGGSLDLSSQHLPSPVHLTGSLTEQWKLTRLVCSLRVGQALCLDSQYTSPPGPLTDSNGGSTSPHFSEGAVEAQRGRVIYPKSHSSGLHNQAFHHLLTFFIMFLPARFWGCCENS